MFLKLTFLAATGLLLSQSLAAAEYWVATTGSDSNSCSRESACKSIQKGIGLLNPGDTLYISAGTYIEDSSKSSFTKRCGWFDPLVASLCINKSGTKTNPITISAAAGDERKVIIDSQGQRAGLQIGGNDYIVFKGLTFKNQHTVGIANWGQAENAVADIPRLAEGIVIDGCSFFYTYGPAGDNISSIAMWGSKDWTVRNNLIDGSSAAGTTVASGIQAYGVINALIENNTIRNVGFGIFWKDHYVKDLANREPWQESEIRYNHITAPKVGIRISIRGDKSPEAGHNFIHHNIITGLDKNGIGIEYAMSGAYGISGDLIVNNNLIDADWNAGSVGLSVDSARSLKMNGNIFARLNVPFQLIKFHDTKLVRLQSSNFNIFDSKVTIIADRYSASTKLFSSLSSWALTKKGELNTVDADFPDKDSIAINSDLLFDSKSAYTYRTQSAALNFLPTGKNAGPYDGSGPVGISFDNSPPGAVPASIISPR